MKFIQITALAAAFSFGASAFAQTPPAETMRIRNAVGQIVITQNGRTVTLNPGDPIPDITDPSATFTAVNGAIDMTVNGETIHAGVGATFAISVVNGAVSVAATGSAAVAIQTADGHNVTVTGGSAVNMAPTTDGQQVAITVTSGNALVSDSSGGQAQTVAQGQTVDVSATSIETAYQTITEGPREVQPLPTTTTDTGLAIQSGVVSGSTPQ